MLTKLQKRISSSCRVGNVVREYNGLAKAYFLAGLVKDNFNKASRSPDRYIKSLIKQGTLVRLGMTQDQAESWLDSTMVLGGAFNIANRIVSRTPSVDAGDVMTALLTGTNPATGTVKNQGKPYPYTIGETWSNILKAHPGALAKVLTNKGKQIAMDTLSSSRSQNTSLSTPVGEEGGTTMLDLLESGSEFDSTMSGEINSLFMDPKTMRKIKSFVFKDLSLTGQQQQVVDAVLSNPGALRQTTNGLTINQKPIAEATGISKTRVGQVWRNVRDDVFDSIKEAFMSEPSLMSVIDRIEMSRTASIKRIVAKYVTQSKTQKMSSGSANSIYLNSLSGSDKLKILENIANHYGTSVSRIQKEVTDPNAENLYEYVTDNRMRMRIYRAFKSQGLGKNASINWIKEAKKNGLFCEREKYPYLAQEEYIFWSDPSIKDSTMIGSDMGDLSVTLWVLENGYQLFTGNKSETFQWGKEKAIMREIVSYFNKFA